MPLNNFNPDPNNSNGSSGSTGGVGGPAGPGSTGGTGSPSGPIGPCNQPWMGGMPDEFDPDEYLINYNKKFQNAQPALFRDTIIQQTLSCLIGKYKPNALLVGAAGVGKTKIVEEIARKIAIKDPLIPDQLMDYTIWELPLSNIVSGSGLVGDVEKKTKMILDFAKDPANKVILFIDEIHMLIDGDKTYEKIAQLMKPALARNDMRVIGGTTTQEVQNLNDDPAFKRRYTRLIVDELTQEQTEVILNQLKVPMFEHYNRKIAINDKVIKEIILVADEYQTIMSHRPDNAITLLDRSMADAYIQRKILERQAQNDPNMQAALNATPTITLSKSQMRKTAMALLTGNSKKNPVQIGDLKSGLSVIKGQDEAIGYIIDCIERDSLNIYPRKRPLTLLFAGNSGVGKSEIAKIIAQVMTNVKPIILNMTEYHSSASINRIIGAPAGYVGSDSKTELPFDILETNPYQVILLDEFEKADKSVQRLFMSAFDEGYIRTARGKIVDFSRSIIIATTNAGHKSNSDIIGITKSDENTSVASISSLSDFFDIELLNRFTKILDFNPITKPLFSEILRDTYNRNISTIKQNHSSYSFMPDELPDEEVERLVNKHYTKEFGARPIASIVQKYIEDAALNSIHSRSEQTNNTGAVAAASV